MTACRLLEIAHYKGMSFEKLVDNILLDAGLNK